MDNSLLSPNSKLARVPCPPHWEPRGDDGFPGLGKLPNELKGYIFKNVRSAKDRGNARLACRSWCELMTPIMWETFNTDLHSKENMNIMEFMMSGKSTILPNIRTLNLRVTSRTTKTADNVGYHLGMFLNGLRGDSLKNFWSSDPIASNDFLHLLSTQRKLKSLTAIVSMSDVDSFADSTWLKVFGHTIASCLSEVEDMSVTVANEFRYPGACSQARFFLANAGNLKRVWIRSWEEVPGRDLLGEIFDAPLPDIETPTADLDLSHVTFLSLSRVDLCNTSNTIVEWFDLPNIRTFELKLCEGFQSLLNEMSRLFSLNSPKLKKFTCRFWSNSANSEDLHAVEDFLFSFAGLQEIIVDSGQSELLDKAAATKHGETLRMLLLSTDADESLYPYYSDADISYIIAGCPHLEQFATNLPVPWYFDVFADEALTWNLPSHSNSVGEKNVLESIIEAIACAPSLHTLRIVSINVSMGILRRDADIGFIQAMLANFANNVMQYMVDRGSKVKVIAVSPLLCDDFEELFPADGNGHHPPHYYYARANEFSSNSHSRIVANPFENVVVEGTESDILSVM